MNWPTVPFFCAISVGVSLELSVLGIWGHPIPGWWTAWQSVLWACQCWQLHRGYHHQGELRDVWQVDGWMDGWMDGWFQICFVAVRLPTLEIYLVRKGVKRQPMTAMTCWFWNPPGCHRGRCLRSLFQMVTCCRCPTRGRSSVIMHLDSLSLCSLAAVAMLKDLKSPAPLFHSSG